MGVVKTALFAFSAFAAAASAEGLYWETTLGVAHADYIEQENPRRLQMASDHVVECFDGVPDCVDGEPSGPYAIRDRMEYLGYGPAIDLKVGRGWERWAIFGDVQFMYSEGLHEIDSYVVSDPVEYEGEDDGRDHHHYQEREDYLHFSELHSNATRLFLGGGFTYFPLAKKGSELTGLHAGASFGISIVNTKVYEEKSGADCSNRVSHGFTEISLGNWSVTLDVGHTWPINEKWNMGVALTAAFENPFEVEKEYSMFNLHTVWAGLRFTRK